MKTLKESNVLITGIHGFIGDNLRKRLEEMGAHVYGISLEKDSNKNIRQISISDFDELQSFIAEKKIDVCFHLAGSPLVEFGQQRPRETFKVNVDGTLNVLECARICNVKKVIIASTTHVYGNTKPPYTEKDLPRPSRPYETSKVCADLIAQSYANTFNLPVLIPRFVNIYGPGDRNMNRLIPKTILSLLENKSPSMWGNGLVERDFLFIDDAIDAYIKLAQLDMMHVKDNNIFNFGAETRTSVEHVIGKLINISGKNVRVEKIPSPREDEVTSQYVSWVKAKKILNWTPQVSLDKGLETTYEWYRKMQS